MTEDDKSSRKLNKSHQNPQGDAAAEGLDEHLQAHIGTQLKSMYDSYLNEPIPDRLMELLEKLDDVAGQDAKSRDNGEPRG